MYHSISDDAEAGVSPYYRTCTSPSRFREHLALLKAEGYQGVDLSTGLAWLNSQHGTRTVPHTIRNTNNSQLSTLNSQPSAKYVAITFDDGFQDYYTEAAPVLKEFGFTATMYLPTAFIGESGSRRTFCHRSNSRPSTLNSQLSTRRECLTWDEIREMHAVGIEFGSHTVNHPKLVDLSWPEIESEISNSKSQIEQQLGTLVPAFAYPFAYPSANREFARRFSELLVEVGYQTCTTTTLGRVFPNADPLTLRRLPANAEDDAALLRAKLAGDYDWLGKVQRVSKFLRRKRRRPSP